MSALAPVTYSTCIGCFLLGACRLGFDPTAQGPSDGSFDAPVIPSGWIAHVGFNEGGGTTTVVDGVGVTGTLKSGARFVPGIRGSAVDFSQDLQASVDINATGELQNLGDLTVSSWYQLSSVPTSCFATLFLHGGVDEVDPAYNVQYAFSLDPASGTSGFSFHETGAQGSNRITFTLPSLTYEVGRWTHIALTRSASNQELSVYVNGALVERQAFARLPDRGELGALRIGRDQAPPDGPCGTAFPGLIDEMYFYARTLGDAEIAQLFALDQP